MEVFLYAYKGEKNLKIKTKYGILRCPDSCNTLFLTEIKLLHLLANSLYMET